MFKTQNSRNMTSLGKIGLNTWTYASSKVEWDQVSIVVSIPSLKIIEIWLLTVFSKRVFGSLFVLPYSPNLSVWQSVRLTMSCVNFRPTYITNNPIVESRIKLTKYLKPESIDKYNNAYIMMYLR